MEIISAVPLFNVVIRCNMQQLCVTQQAKCNAVNFDNAASC